MTQRFVCFKKDPAGEMLVCGFDNIDQIFHVASGCASNFKEGRTGKWETLCEPAFSTHIYIDSLDLCSPIKRKIIREELTSSVREAIDRIEAVVTTSIEKSLVTGLIEDACFCKNGNVFKHEDGSTEPLPQN